MTAFTYLGMTVVPEELCAIARAIDADENGWREQVDTLPRYVLTAETLTSEPRVISENLRGIAEFLNRRRDGVPFGGHELAAKAAAAREASKDRPLTFGSRRRRR